MLRALQRTLPALLVFLLAHATRAQSQPFAPSVAPNPYFPAGINDGIISRLDIGALSEHLRGSVSWSSGGSALTRSFSERDPAGTNSWHTVEVLETVSYTMTAVTSRDGGHEVYVAGVEFDGDVVIEQWRYGKRDKGWILVDCNR